MIVSFNTEDVIETHCLKYLFFREKIRGVKMTDPGEQFWVFMQSVKELYPGLDYGNLERPDDDWIFTVAG
jgi:hypothetical protein